MKSCESCEIRRHAFEARSFEEKGGGDVVEMIGNSERREDALCRIRLLTDAHGYGVFEKSLVFREKLKRPGAILCYKAGVCTVRTLRTLLQRGKSGGGS